jgi:hypothetical protein
MKMFSVSEFNLYENHAQAVEACCALNNAILDAETMVMEGRIKKNEAFTKYVSPVMNKYAHVGACDSDARDCIIDCYNETVKRHG